MSQGEKTTSLTISKRECLSVYQNIILNSDRHIANANVLSEREEFGVAISHLVLGSEEMVKALIIFLEGLGLNLRAIKGVKLFFSDHQVRHTFSKFYSWIAITIKRTLELKALFDGALKQKGIDTERGGLNRAIIENDQMKIQQFSKIWAERYGKEQIETMFQQIDFWEQADEYKMKGFYVDYKDDLKTPEQVTYAEYLVALKSASSFIDDCKRVINLFVGLSHNERKDLAKSFNRNTQFKNLIAGVVDKGWDYFERNDT